MDEGGGVRKEGPGRGMRDEMTDRMEEGRGRMYSTYEGRGLGRRENGRGKMMRNEGICTRD